LFRDDPEQDATKPKRRKPKNKHTTAHLPEQQSDGDQRYLAISGIHLAMARIISQVAARRRPCQVLLVLMDGQTSLWETLKLHISFGQRTIPILDILHVLAYVWKAVGLFERGDARRKAFTRKRLRRILRGDVGGVIRGLRWVGTNSGFQGKNAKDLARICGYLERNADRMRYDEYLRRGYPIASGVTEGACRHLAKDRMERSGMRWTLEGTRSMLNVPAAFQSDHWRGFQDSYVERQTSQTYPHRNLPGDYKAMTLAG